jgi:hypothetical protein
MAETRDLKMHLPSQSSDLRFPFEFIPLALGRVGTASRHSLHRVGLSALAQPRLTEAVSPTSIYPGQHVVLSLP